MHFILEEAVQFTASRYRGISRIRNRPPPGPCPCTSLIRKRPPLMLREEVVNLKLEEAVLLLAVGLQTCEPERRARRKAGQSRDSAVIRLHGLDMRQLGLQGADRRLAVLRGQLGPRVRPGAPPCVRRRRLEARKLRQQLRGGNGVRLRGRRLHFLHNRLLRRVRGGKERLEGREGVEDKLRSRLGCRRFVLSPGRDRVESSRKRVLERRDAPCVRRQVGGSVVARRSLEREV